MVCYASAIQQLQMVSSAVHEILRERSGQEFAVTTATQPPNVTHGVSTVYRLSTFSSPQTLSVTVAAALKGSNV